MIEPYAPDVPLAPPAGGVLATSFPPPSISSQELALSFTFNGMARPFFRIRNRMTAAYPIRLSASTLDRSCVNTLRFMPLDAGQGLLADIHVPMGAASMAHAYGLSSSISMPPIQNDLTAISLSLPRDTDRCSCATFFNSGDSQPRAPAPNHPKRCAGQSDKRAA